MTEPIPFTHLPPPPSLVEMKTRVCSVEELQAALIKLIDLYNEQALVMEAAINRKQNQEWRASL